MLLENELVPFEAKPLLGERLLVLAPHPDDEVLGCGGVLALNASQQRQITVVVATDGTAADSSQPDSTAYRARREDETVAGLGSLGIVTPPSFLHLPDRSLRATSAELSLRIREAILDSRPDLILAPSPVETHPDHVALAMTLVDLIQSDETLRGLLAITRVAFYEVSQPIRPNTLVDISAVADKKRSAMEAHTSQHELRDYARYISGLNEYRTMSLSREATAAEAFWVTSADTLRTTPWTALCAALSPRSQRPVEVLREPIEATVVIRTKDRPVWLREAVASIKSNTLPGRIVVVNDGGASPRELLEPFGDAVDLVENERSLGRAEAMNEGVHAASTPWIAFLDDDDLFYPEHLQTLAAGASSGTSPAYYTDAVSVSMERGADGGWVERSRLRQYAQDFDADLLLVDNYIPLPTLLLRKADYLAVGGFDPAFELFEDWDFLLRLASLGPFQRIPRVTCEIRHFPASGSIVVATPEGTRAFRDAKLPICNTHRALLTYPASANAFERHKTRLLETISRAVEAEGLASFRENDTTRLEREKTQLLRELDQKHALWELDHAQLEQERASRERERARGLELERELSRLEALAREANEDRLRAEEELQRRNGECASLRAMLDEHRVAVDKQATAINELFREIERLNGVLDTIYRSKTWKLHQSLRRLTGRG